jgi:glycosyltransferase involved in cell wall biosynthesis
LKHNGFQTATPASAGDQLSRIGFDTRNLALPAATGIGTYAATLSRACTELGYSPTFLDAAPPRHAATRLLHAMRGRYRLRNGFRAPDIYRIAQQHFDIYGRLLHLEATAAPPAMHWTYPLPLALVGVPNIVTIHDLIPLTAPELTGIDSPRMHRILRQCAQNATAIVTVSKTVRAQIIDRLGIAPARVWNLYQAADVARSPAPPVCPAGSFLVVGTVETRKNIARLIAAHAASDVRAPLVIIGPDGPGAQKLLVGAGDRVIRLPHMPRPVLLRAMAEARAVLFPSLAEGFGLPIAEAMALGVPVMTARAGATEEVAGGAALLIDPLSVADMARAITRLAQDDALCARLRAAGLARSAVFSMSAYIERLRPFYQAILPRTAHMIPPAAKSADTKSAATISHAGCPRLATTCA